MAVIEYVKHIGVILLHTNYTNYTPRNSVMNSKLTKY